MPKFEQGIYGRHPVGGTAKILLWHIPHPSAFTCEQLKHFAVNGCKFVVVCFQLDCEFSINIFES